MTDVASEASQATAAPVVHGDAQAPKRSPGRPAGSGSGTPKKGGGNLPLADGVVRHALLVDRKARDKFSQWAQAFETNQGALLAALVEELTKPEVKARVGAWLAANGHKSMVKSITPEIKEALKAVDQAELLAFLKSKGAIKP